MILSCGQLTSGQWLLSIFSYISKSKTHELLTCQRFLVEYVRYLNLCSTSTVIQLHWPVSYRNRAHSTCFQYSGRTDRNLENFRFICNGLGSEIWVLGPFKNNIYHSHFSNLIRPGFLINPKTAVYGERFFCLIELFKMFLSVFMKRFCSQIFWKLFIIPPKFIFSTSFKTQN